MIRPGNNQHKPSADEPKPMTEQDLKIIAERAFNVFIAMDPAVRDDLQRMVAYCGVLRRTVVQMNQQQTAWQDTMMVVCKRAPEHEVRVSDTDVMTLDVKDTLHIEDVKDQETQEATKIFRFVPATRILQ